VLGPDRSSPLPSPAAQLCTGHTTPSGVLCAGICCTWSCGRSTAPRTCAPSQLMTIRTPGAVSAPNHQRPGSNRQKSLGRHGSACHAPAPTTPASHGTSGMRLRGCVVPHGTVLKVISLGRCQEGCMHGSTARLTSGDGLSRCIRRTTLVVVGWCGGLAATCKLHGLCCAVPGGLNETWRMSIVGAVRGDCCAPG
jgi:hypothetical protein